RRHAPPSPGAPSARATAAPAPGKGHSRPGAALRRPSAVESLGPAGVDPVIDLLQRREAIRQVAKNLVARLARHGARPANLAGAGAAPRFDQIARHFDVTL